MTSAVGRTAGVGRRSSVPAVSALVPSGPAARAARFAHNGLDRPGRRWLLGGLASAAVSLDERRRVRIRWADGVWEHRIGPDTVLNHRILRPSRSVDENLEIFLWDHDVAPGEVVLDIGAGTGTEVVPLARRVGPAGRVIAVEAHPAAAAILRQVGPVNGLENITVVEAAVAAAPGVLRITDGDESVANRLEDGGAHEVEAVTIDGLLERLGLDRVDLLKMNIEGAETEALRGLDEHVGRVAHLTVSCHDFLGTEVGRSRSQVHHWLTSHHFEVRTRSDPRPWARDCLYGRRADPPSPGPDG